MLNIRFEAQGDRYLRVITFPDATTSEELVSFPRKWHSPEQYQWIRPLYEYERSELVEEGKFIASTLLGTEGIQFPEELHGVQEGTEAP